MRRIVESQKCEIIVLWKKLHFENITNNTYKHVVYSLGEQKNIFKMESTKKVNYASSSSPVRVRLDTLRIKSQFALG